MRQKRTIQLAAFNIVTHPHSTRTYIELFHSALKQKRVIKIRGDTHGLLGTMIQHDNYSEPVVTGEIFTFFDLDVTRPWFDILRGEAADKTQTKEVKIPPFLRPHLKHIRYIFLPANHLFVFVCQDSAKERGSISPQSMSDFLTQLLNDREILTNAKFRNVEVRSVQDRKTLKWIFSELQVESLEIKVRRPNGDTGGDARKSVEEELEEQNIEEYFVKQTAEKGKGIVPNASTNRLLNEAMNNGGVRARGRDRQRKMHTVNTEDKPLVEPIEISSKKQYAESVIVAGLEFAKKAYQHIKINAGRVLSNFEDDNS